LLQFISSHHYIFDAHCNLCARGSRKQDRVRFERRFPREPVYLTKTSSACQNKSRGASRWKSVRVTRESVVLPPGKGACVGSWVVQVSDLFYAAASPVHTRVTAGTGWSRSQERPTDRKAHAVRRPRCAMGFRRLYMIPECHAYSSHFSFVFHDPFAGE
jgi:hypothetical protein